jgi:hypothetical protein
MQTPYRSPAPKSVEKRKSAFMSFLKSVGNFIGDHFEVFAMVTGFLILVGGVSAMFYGLDHDTAARRMHADHDQYVLRQEICKVHYGWYVPSGNYHGLMACRSLDDHSLFFVIEDTGLEVYTAPVDSE